MITGRAWPRGRSWPSWSRWSQGDALSKTTHRLLLLGARIISVLVCDIVRARPQGDKGDMGQEGDKGEKGETGLKGKEGPPGSSGLTGVRVSGLRCCHVSTVNEWSLSPSAELLPYCFLCEGSWRETWKIWRKRQTRFKGINLNILCHQLENNDFTWRNINWLKWLLYWLDLYTFRAPKVIKVSSGRQDKWGRLDHQALLGRRGPEEQLGTW